VVSLKEVNIMLNEEKKGGGILGGGIGNVSINDESFKRSTSTFS
jgi:hypothetical protein